MRVLVVEDDRRIAADVARALEAAGYVPETVRDGEEAWFRGEPRTTAPSCSTSACRRWMASPCSSAGARTGAARPC